MACDDPSREPVPAAGSTSTRDADAVMPTAIPVRLRAGAGAGAVGGVRPLRAHSTPPGRLPTTPRATNSTDRANAAGSATPAASKKSTNAAWLVPSP